MLAEWTSEILSLYAALRVLELHHLTVLMPNIGSICKCIQLSLKVRSVKLQSDRMWEQLHYSDSIVVYCTLCHDFAFPLKLVQSLRNFNLIVRNSSAIPSCN